MLAALSFLAQAAVGLAQRFRTQCSTVPLPDGDESVLRCRFLHFSGDAGQRRRLAIVSSLHRVFLAVHRARQDLADLLASMAGAGPEPPGVRASVTRWFGGLHREVDPFQVRTVLDVLREVHRGMRGTVLVVKATEDESAIAWAAGRGMIHLGPRYWNEPRAERRMAGILYHELTHSFAGTVDTAACATGLVYIHEPEGTELAFAADPPEYYDNEADTPGGIFPSPEDLVRLADTHECFLEECYLR